MGSLGNERSCYLGRALRAGVSGSMETLRRLIKYDSAQPLIFGGGPVVGRCAAPTAAIKAGLA